jgi:hypothetical protein
MRSDALPTLASHGLGGSESTTPWRMNIGNQDLLNNESVEKELLRDAVSTSPSKYPILNNSNGYHIFQTVFFLKILLVGLDAADRAVAFFNSIGIQE